MNYVKQFMDDNLIEYERPIKISDDMTVAFMQHNGELYMMVKDITAPTRYRVEQINPLFIDMLSGKIKGLKHKV